MKAVSYRYAFVAAVGIHVGLFGLLVGSLSGTHLTVSSSTNKPTQPAVTRPQPEVIEATMVDAQALDEAVAKLEAKAQAKQAAEAKQAAALKQMAAQRQAEEEKVKALRKAQAAMKAQAAKKLEDEKAALEKVKKAKAEALLAQKAAEAKAKAAEEKRKATEAARLAAKKKAEAEAKAQAAEKEKQAALAAKEAAEAKARRQTEATNIAHQFSHMIGRKVTDNWRKPIGTQGHRLSCTVSIRTLPTGDVVEARVIRSSGDVEFDRSSELAILKASPLPMPSDELALAQFRHFDFEFKPEE